MGGNSSSQDSRRNLNRILIYFSCAIFLVALVGVPLYFYLRTNQSVRNTCHENLSVTLSNPVFQPDGSVVDGNETYPAGYYFTTNGTVRGCLCVLKPCIRKCCGEDEYLVKIPGYSSKCEVNPGPSPFDNFSIPVHKSPGEPIQVDRDHFRILYGDVCKNGKFILNPINYPEDRHDLMVDGRFRHVAGGRLIDVSQYCLESTSLSEEIRTFVCFADPTVDYETKIQQFVYPVAMIISMPFLLATILVYSTLPGLRNLHGKSLICQCSSLLVTYFGLTILQLKGEEITPFWCVSLALMVQFTFLGSFCWLNIMCFDIWWSFSGHRPLQWRHKAKEHNIFLLYSVYAWGVPLIIVAATAAVDMIPSIPDYVIKPQLGTDRCWFKDSQGSLLYFYFPAGVVLCLNIVMFAATVLKLKSYTKTDPDQIRFHVYLRLFIVMGLNWILELLSFLVGGPKSLWFVTDISNSLQGVLIFLLFVCKQEILKKLKKKLCSCCNLNGGPSQENSRSQSDSVSFTKTEADVVGLKTLNDSGDKKSNEA